jgi:hypothetical protein
MPKSEYYTNNEFGFCMLRNKKEMIVTSEISAPDDEEIWISSRRLGDNFKARA